MMKDEAGGKIIEEFVGLRAKLYSYKMFEEKEEKKCKGIKKCVVKKNISYEDYKECLFSKKPQMREMNFFINFFLLKNTKMFGVAFVFNRKKVDKKIFFYQLFSVKKYQKIWSCVCF